MWNKKDVYLVATTFSKFDLLAQKLCCSRYSTDNKWQTTTMEGGTMENSDTLDRSEDEIALQGFCSPKRPPYRFLGLALMCLLGFGTNRHMPIICSYVISPISCSERISKRKKPAGWHISCQFVSFLVYTSHLRVTYVRDRNYASAMIVLLLIIEKNLTLLR